MRLLKPVLTTTPKVVDVDDKVVEPAWLIVHQPSEPHEFRVYPPFAGFREDSQYGDHYVTLPEAQREELIDTFGKYNQRFNKAFFHTQQRWQTTTHGDCELFLVTTPSGIELTPELFHHNLPAVKERYTEVKLYKLTDPALLAGFELHYCRALERETAWLVVIPNTQQDATAYDRVGKELNDLLREILERRIKFLRKETSELVDTGKRRTKLYVQYSRILRTLANSQHSKPVRAALLNAVMTSLPSSLSGMFLYQQLLELKVKDGLDVDYSAFWSLFDPAIGRQQFYQAMVRKHVIDFSNVRRYKGLLFGDTV